MSKEKLSKAKDRPNMWVKCPECKELLYAEEVARLNKCPKEKCGYIFPYPFAKAWEAEKLLQSGTTQGEFSEFVLGVLNSINDADQKASFLRVTYKLVLSDFEWRQIQKKKNIA